MRLPEFPHAAAAGSTSTRSRRSTTSLGHRRRRRRAAVAAGSRGGSRPSSGGIVGPPLQKQAAFNSTARRSPQPQRGRASRGAARDRQRDRDAARADRRTCSLFQSRLVVYLQQITLYVDTKDRETAGQALIVNAALNGARRGPGEAVESTGRARAALRGAGGRPRRRARRAAHARRRLAAGVDDDQAGDRASRCASRAASRNAQP